MAGAWAGSGFQAARALAPYAKVVASAWADGTWRSLVAHLTGGQGVAGSNPAVPTSVGRPRIGLYAPGQRPVSPMSPGRARRVPQMRWGPLGDQSLLDSTGAMPLDTTWA